MAHTHSTRIEGTPEQLAAQLGQLPHGKRYRLVEVEEPTSQARKPAPRRISALGKYPGTLNSEDFMRRKHEETLLEDRPIR